MFSKTLPSKTRPPKHAELLQRKGTQPPGSRSGCETCNKHTVRQEAALLWATYPNNARTLPMHGYHLLHALHHQRPLPQLMQHNPMDEPFVQFLPAAPGMEYDFSDLNAQLYSPSMTTDHRRLIHHAAPSPPVVDEPVTPEPTSFTRATMSAVAPRVVVVAHSTTPPAQHPPARTTMASLESPQEEQAHNYSLHNPNAVGVYDEVAERYGWGSSTTNGGGGGSGSGSGGVGAVPLDGLHYCAPPDKISSPPHHTVHSHPRHTLSMCLKQRYQKKKLNATTTFFTF